MTVDHRAAPLLPDLKFQTCKEHEQGAFQTEHELRAESVRQNSSNPSIALTNHAAASTPTFHNSSVPPFFSFHPLSLPLPSPLCPSIRFQASLPSELNNTHQAGQIYSSFHSHALAR
ncbi:hypothetical protein ILYODFUR_035218 [Ilyodon furcidens]|uniref:Uncharacterized protein n=1 Tax=Ilyodon furcidens TaxID=33524 RepID=A0ABV0TPH0_9TELE